MDSLIMRLISAFLLLPLILFLGFVGGWALWSLILVFGGIALWELCNLLGVDVFDRVPSYLIFLFFLLGLRPEIPIPLEWSLALSIVVAALYILIKGGNNRSQRIALYVFAPIYLGFLLRFIYLLRDRPPGFYLLILFLLGTFASDTVAYFVGKLWGERRIFPKISPGKTLEGTLFSPLGGIAGAVFTAFIFQQPLLPVIPLGFLISIFALVGDLFESIFKREAQQKDSSKLIPGHGGFLDRLDSLLFTAPVVYFYSILVMGCWK